MSTPTTTRKKRRIKPMSIVIVLLLLLIVENTVICILLLSDKSNAKICEYNPELGVLVIEKTNDVEESELSDIIQITNAIKNGGLIKIKSESDWISSHFPSEYIRYGAMNNDGAMWTEGAYLNYIAHKGWQLIDAENDMLYFVSIEN